MTHEEKLTGAHPQAGGDMNEALAQSDSKGEAPQREGGLRRFLTHYAPLWPYALGIACARAGMSVSTADSYKSTDDGIFSDGALVVALVALIIAGVALYKTEHQFSKKAIRRINYAAVVVQVVVLVVMGLLRLSGACTFPVRFTLCVVMVLAALTATGCWLRAMRGACMVPAAVMVFSGLFLSEIPVFATTLLPDGARCLAIAPVVACQALCVRWARISPNSPASIEAPRRDDDYFPFMKGVVSRQFLVACAAGIAAMSLVVGFLRGFPSGDPVAFCTPTRIAAFVLTEAACLWFIASVLRQKARAMTVTIWVLLELLAALTLVLYTAFPNHLDVGAVAIVTLNALMTAFLWYIIISFMSSGWREPLYYAICILAIWVLSRAIGRFVLLGVMPIGGDSHFTGSVISLLLLVSTQLILVKLIDVAQFAARRAAVAQHAGGSAAGQLASQAVSAGASRAGGGKDGEIAEVEAEEILAARPAAIDKLLGLDDHSSVAAVQRAAMQHRVEALGKQFLLSDREIEVLALYASGITQKRVAESLHISQTTAHTHITRIYAKTGLHSRQEIIDYLQKYAEE